LRIFLALAAQLEFDVVSADVPTAFLQQDESHAKSRDPIYLKPPPGEGEGVFWKTHKIVYGLKDAPRAWWKTFNLWMVSLNFYSLPEDPCVYIIRHEGKIWGQVLVHVDDTLIAGSPEFVEWFTWQLTEKWSIKEITRADEGDGIKFCGLWIRQSEGILVLNQTPYAEMIDELWWDKSQSETQPLTAEQVTAVQSVCGAGNWLSTQSRPDISWLVSDTISSLSVDNNLSVLKKANKLVRLIKSNAATKICFEKLPCNLEDLCLVIYSDASWANMSNLRSQSGQTFILAAHPKDFSGDEFHGNMIHWRSTRIRRVCSSTFAAETLSAVDAKDTGANLKSLLQHWLDMPIRMRLKSDCNSLVTSMKKIDPESTEKRLKLDLLSLKEDIESGELEELEWVPTDIMYADTLTKHMDAIDILTAMWQNKWNCKTSIARVARKNKSAVKAEAKAAIAFEEQRESLLAFVGDETEVYG